MQRLLRFHTNDMRGYRPNAAPLMLGAMIAAQWPDRWGAES